MTFKKSAPTLFDVTTGHVLGNKGNIAVFSEKGKTKQKNGKNAIKHKILRKFLYHFLKEHSHAYRYHMREWHELCFKQRNLI